MRSSFVCNPTVWFRALAIVCAAVAALPLFTPAFGAEEFSVAPLSADEQQAIDTIREGSVLSTVSFLASDEMAGRDTPSRELEIASAYVAARFRGAGLEGLSPDGSYYQTTYFEQSSPPTDGLLFLIDGVPVDGAMVLMTSSEDVTIKGSVTAENETSDKPAFVRVPELPLPPQASSSPAMVLSLWARRIRGIAGSGAGAILVPIGKDSILPDVVRQLRNQPVSLSPQFPFTCPVVLVPDSAVLDGDISLTVPARVTTRQPVHNVIGVLRGADPNLAKQAVIVSAHLDHIGTTSLGEDRINNGADDNATGVTAVLTMADAYAALRQRPERSMIFITFWGEEKGLLGSKYFAANPLWPLEDVVANVNIEMIGRPEDGAESKAWGTGWTRSTLGDQMATGAARVNMTIFHHEEFSEMLYARSDNFSLVQQGVIAHSFSAGSLHSDYHQPTDEVAKLNTAHMTSVIRGLVAGTLPIAHGELTPEKTAR